MPYGLEPSRMTNDTIASRLRDARERAGMSQASVGAALDPAKPLQAVSRYERGGAVPNIGTVRQLASVLHVEPCWLAWGIEHGK